MSGATMADEGRPVARDVARQAAYWLACLHGGEARPEEVEACRRWRAADPEHERAWQLAQRVNEKFGLVPSAVGVPVLGRKVRIDRRRALKTLVVLMTAVPAGYVVSRLPWSEWQADYRTETGRRDLVLADGTRLQMDAHTAVDVRFDEGQRLLLLHAGRILVTTGKDGGAQAYRPFLVQTAQGRIRALGTQFIVDRRVSDVQLTRVTVLQHAVEIKPADAPERRRVLQAGQQASFDARDIAITATVPHAADWARGVLFVSNMRLEDFAVELGRYRAGFLHCDPAVADLRISGAFQLDNTDRILAALPDTLPVEVVSRTRYWVTIAAPRKKAD